MNPTIKADLYRVKPAEYSIRSLISGFRSPGFKYLFFLRLAANSRKHSPVWYFARIILRHYLFKFGFQIPYNTKIGPGFFIGHIGPVVISVNAVIGSNCNIAHCVTIGRDHRGNRRGAPVIGDYVWIGTGAIIVGRIRIGNNVLIAPGAFINFDVPDHSIVIGNPGKIIQKDNPVEGYINNVL